MDEIQRGEIWWADLPALVVQADSFNRSDSQTAIVAAITGNLDLGDDEVEMPSRADGVGPRRGIPARVGAWALARGQFAISRLPPCFLKAVGVSNASSQDTALDFTGANS